MFSFVVQSQRGFPGLLPLDLFVALMGPYGPLWAFVGPPMGSCWASPRALFGPALGRLWALHWALLGPALGPLWALPWALVGPALGLLLGQP